MSETGRGRVDEGAGKCVLSPFVSPCVIVCVRASVREFMRVRSESFPRFFSVRVRVFFFASVLLARNLSVKGRGRVDEGAG